MLTGLSQTIPGHLQNLAGLEARVRAEQERLELEHLQAQDPCVLINVTGGRQACFAICMQLAQAVQLSSLIIARAVAADFPASQIDLALASNTIGEFMNIVLGEYFMKHPVAAGPAALSAPLYHSMQEQSALLAGMQSQIVVEAPTIRLDLLYRVDAL